MDGKISELLSHYCGLSDTAGRRGIAASAEAAGRVQWDGRLSVMLKEDWSAPPPDFQCTVFGRLPRTGTTLRCSSTLRTQSGAP